MQAWRELKYDYASQRPGGGQVGRLKTLSVEKGLLRECEGVLRLAGALLKCKVIEHSVPIDGSFSWEISATISH